MVCDDRVELRQAIRLALSSHPALRIVGEAEDGPSCLREVGRLQPDLLILDVNMPGGGPELARQLRERWPDLFILVYSGVLLPHVQTEMLAAGADRFVLKTGRLRPLMEALSSAAA